MIWGSELLNLMAQILFREWILKNGTADTERADAEAGVEMVFLVLLEQFTHWFWSDSVEFLPHFNRLVEKANWWDSSGASRCLSFFFGR